MVKLSEKFKAAISALSKNELEKIVIKQAIKDKDFYNYLYVNFGNTKHGEQELFEQAQLDLAQLMNKNYRGFSEGLRLANMLSACNKRIDQFSIVCKNKSLELEIVMKVLALPFSLSSNMFTTCFINYNYKVYLLLKKTINLLETKMHPDFLVQYSPTLNNYLAIFHQTSSHSDYVYNFKKKIEIN